MTITTNPSRDEYTSTAGQTVFNYTFKIYANTDLNVYVTPSGQSPDDSADLTTDYVVDTGTIGDEAGGFITFNTPLNNGDAVTIVSAIPYDRTVDYQNNGDFLPETVNDDNDRQVSQIKQILEQTGRTLQFQESLQGASTLSLPDPVSQNFMRWKTDLTGLENVELVDGALVVADGQLLIFPTVAALKASTSALLVPGVNVQTQGYYSAGDGGGANYLIVTPQAADEFGDHTLNNGNVAAIQNENGKINVRQYGCRGDGVTDDTAIMFNALERSKILQLVTLIPKGVYVINELEASNNTRIECEGYRRQDEASNGVVFKATTGTYCLKCFDYRSGRGVEGYAISGLKIIGNTSTQYGLILIGTDARVFDIVVDNVPNGVGVQVGFSWRSLFDNIKITNCGVGLQINDETDSVPINGCVFNTLTIELCTVGIYHVRDSGTAQSVANTFNGLIIEGIKIDPSRSFPSFLTVNPFAASELGMDANTITGAFFTEQEFHCVINGWYSENVEGVHIFNGYYCEIQMNSPYFEIERYPGDLVREYPMISSNQSAIQLYNPRILHENLNSNGPIISVNPNNNNIFEGIQSVGTNVARDFYTYLPDPAQDTKFYDATYLIGTYETSTGTPIKRGGVFNNTLRSFIRSASYTNRPNNTYFDVTNLGAIILEVSDDVNRNYYLDGITDNGQNLKISLVNSHPTNSVVIYMHSDVDGGISNNLGGLYNVTIPAKTTRTLDIVNLGGTDLYLVGGGDVTQP